MKFASGLAVLSVVAAAALAPGQARANNEVEVFSANGVARCQAANAASEAQLRRRPLSVVNEGTSAVFVSCAFELEVNQSLAQGVEVWVHNAGATDVDVTCTGINSFQYGPNEYLPQTQTVAAGSQSPDSFFWADSDFADGADGLISVSCQLPPGTGIDDTYASFIVDDAPTVPAP